MPTTTPTENVWSPAAPAADQPPRDAARPDAPPGARLVGDVLVASDATELAGNAARVALAVAQRHRRGVQVVTVATELPGAAASADAAAAEAGAAESRRGEVRATLAAALDAPIDWPVRVGLGGPADVIVREAGDAGAGLLVLGLRRHGPLGRALQDETTLRVMRQATWPVLGVVPALRALPTRVLAAVDFGRASRAAALLASSLVAPGGTLTLAYVPSISALENEDGEAHVHELGVRAAFDELRAMVRPADGVVVDTVVLDVSTRRPIGEQLLDLAERSGAELVALGTRRYGPFERWLLGSVTRDVVRDGRVSVLVVPPPAGDAPTPAP